MVCTPEYNSSGVSALKVASGSKIRLAKRDQRQALSAPSRSPEKTTPANFSDAEAAPNSRNSSASNNSNPLGVVAKKFMVGFSVLVVKFFRHWFSAILCETQCVLEFYILSDFCGKIAEFHLLLNSDLFSR